MLLRFGVRNFRSMRDKQELSLVASSLRDVDTGLITAEAVPNGKLLPAVVIYGANASGKSTLVSALRWMRSAVLYSHSRSEPGKPVPTQPFLLDPKSASSATTCDIDFILDGVRHHYGFDATEEGFVSEWLYSFPSDRRQTLFDRDRSTFTFGRGLRGQNRVISGLTRPNSLFVSAAAQNDHEYLTKISGFFRALKIDASSAYSVGDRRLTSTDLTPRVIDFLKGIGTGVVGYRREKRPITEDGKQFRKALSLLLSKHLGSYAPQDLDEKEYDLSLAHESSDHSEVYLDLSDESAGTRRLLVLLKNIFKALDEGGVLVIDELDASLHTRACEGLLSLFSLPAKNPKGAQLVATTHDTNLLRSPFLRRDQVWFTEKNSEGATSLYPLTDIRSRRGDNIEKGYLEGRYGAIPFSGSISGLFRTV